MFSKSIGSPFSVHFLPFFPDLAFLGFWGVSTGRVGSQSETDNLSDYHEECVDAIFGAEESTVILAEFVHSQASADTAMGGLQKDAKSSFWLTRVQCSLSLSVECTAYPGTSCSCRGCE
eukprot:1193887-Amphidinium_carterae.1